MSNKSEAMKKAWATRRKNAGGGSAVAAGKPSALRAKRAKTGEATTAKRASTASAETKWRSNPTCCCGCNAPLVKRGPKTQSLFKSGHDAKLHSLVRQGKPLPDVAEAMRAHISFLNKESN